MLSKLPLFSRIVFEQRSLSNLDVFHLAWFCSILIFTEMIHIKWVTSGGVYLIFSYNSMFELWRQMFCFKS